MLENLFNKSLWLLIHQKIVVTHRSFIDLSSSILHNVDFHRTYIFVSVLFWCHISLWSELSTDSVLGDHMLFWGINSGLAACKAITRWIIISALETFVIFYFLFRATPGNAQDLLLVLYSTTTSAKANKIIEENRNWN